VEDLLSLAGIPSDEERFQESWRVLMVLARERKVNPVLKDCSNKYARDARANMLWDTAPHWSFR
jgi:hypothetical protein